MNNTKRIKLSTIYKRIIEECDLSFNESLDSWVLDGVSNVFTRFKNNNRLMISEYFARRLSDWALDKLKKDYLNSDY